ncbi:hypothetical protein SARC_02047 [Sphaeroforma arctica JP610]|uniref:PX domain-containing protein n=1 Tax=Sphaeroforma arctica JP610 TaxID=667725 RepID=A0A0L0GA46_9EUKA|nr:hypothetical protein SARC_02047 [Sphaeroforma arctica JP610]KNC85784.1 hypothetical protein SARC_02047 [Sphaeroforma arctica JP610]|eukprot:XP_014159686.1 hypothetical protein SARC_02047 [Sphaeroforma arctica JP610]
MHTFITDVRNNDEYRSYLVLTVFAPKVVDGPSRVTRVWRRYSEFIKLREYLARVYSFVILPVLPPKRINSTDEKVISVRRSSLASYLQRLLDHDLTSKDTRVLLFITAEPFDAAVLLEGKPPRSLSISLTKPIVSDSVSEIVRSDSKAIALQTALSNVLRHRSCRSKCLQDLRQNLEVCGGLYQTWAKDETDLRSPLQTMYNLICQQPELRGNAMGCTKRMSENCRMLGSLRKAVAAYSAKCSAQQDKLEQLVRAQKDVDDIKAGNNPSRLRALFSGQSSVDATSQLLPNVQAHLKEAKCISKRGDAELKIYERHVQYEIYKFFWRMELDFMHEARDTCKADLSLLNKDCPRC